jgi:hypothetical protein
MVKFEVVSEMAVSACCTEHWTNYLPVANAANNPEPLETPNRPEIHFSVPKLERPSTNSIKCRAISMPASLQLSGWLHLKRDLAPSGNGARVCFASPDYSFAFSARQRINVL